MHTPPVRPHPRKAAQQAPYQLVRDVAGASRAGEERSMSVREGKWWSELARSDTGGREAPQRGSERRESTYADLQASPGDLCESTGRGRSWRAESGLQHLRPPRGPDLGLLAHSSLPATTQRVRVDDRTLLPSPPRPRGSLSPPEQQEPLVLRLFTRRARSATACYQISELRLSVVATATRQQCRPTNRQRSTRPSSLTATRPRTRGWNTPPATLRRPTRGDGD